MKIHTTNYVNTLIEIAEDCPVNSGLVPPYKGDRKSVANLQFEMLSGNAYKFDSDDVLFSVFAMRMAIEPQDLVGERKLFFSKGQPCFRASPLTKRYGFGVHADENGKIALFGSESEEYKKLQKNTEVRKLKAMRSKKV